ncbi:hypothetical protein RJ639_027811 [Escallonia herrerae]|uniref:Pectinesterase inhibitor domain-containing protein n=1 Tax=Escallonia herrerae TaxID=1293975 RepID=A0AA88XJJ6_9ASTE|nr:hypothetical protein RJ639_027811 [Escallonia herrerae]
MEGYSSNHFLLALYLLLAFTTYINSSSAAAATSTEFIKTSCSATTYPTLCFNSLSSRASAIQNSPKLLAHESLSVALDTARSTSTMMLRLSHTRGMKPRENGAMKDCVEELSDSVDELMNSLGEMSQPKGKSFELMISDIQTWVSAALTDEDTCSEGFAGNAMNGKIKNIVRGRIVNVAHLTSNALALINNYARTP